MVMAGTGDVDPFRLFCALRWRCDYILMMQNSRRCTLHHVANIQFLSKPPHGTMINRHCLWTLSRASSATFRIQMHCAHCLLRQKSNIDWNQFHFFKWSSTVTVCKVLLLYNQRPEYDVLFERFWHDIADEFMKDVTTQMLLCYQNVFRLIESCNCSSIDVQNV